MSRPEEPSHEPAPSGGSLAPTPGTVAAPAPGAALTLTRTSPSSTASPPEVYLQSLTTPVSRSTMRSALNTVAKLLGTPQTRDPSGAEVTYLVCPWHLLRYEQTAALRSVLAERYKPRTANKLLAALRGTLKEAWRLGYLTAEERDRALDVRPLRGKSLPTGRALSRQELTTLLATCANDLPPGGPRDAAILAVSYSGLLRRSETVALQLADYDPTTGALTILNGKGHKDDVAYLAPGAQQALDDWITVRGAHPGPLFCPYTRSGRLIFRALRPSSLHEMCGRRATQAAIPPCSPHDFRRSGITALLASGVDVSLVRMLARHEHVETTIGYDRRGEEAKQQAAQLLAVPYISLHRRAGP